LQKRKTLEHAKRLNDRWAKKSAEAHKKQLLLVSTIEKIKETKATEKKKRHFDI